jgi:uncharacterized protein (DUF58 family)
MNGMSLRRNAFLLILMTAAVAIGSEWSGDPALTGLWHALAALLLLGLAYESWGTAKQQLTVEVQAPEQLRLGRRAELIFKFTHAAPRKVILQMAPSSPEHFEMQGAVETLEISPGACIATQAAAIGCRLGEFDWPDFPARIAGPLGLAWWPRQIACRRRIRVVPDLFHSAVQVKGAQASGNQSGLDAGAGAEVLRLREYRAGDPPRVIDWKATARAGRLISRDFSQDSGLQIIVAIDAGRSSSVQAGTLNRFGHYVNVAARLAQFAIAREDLVGLIIFADRPLAALAPARGSAAMTRIRSLLGSARIERAESNPLYAATRIRSLVRHRSLIVMLTDIDDASAHSQLLQAVKLLLPKHLPFIAGLSSAEVESMARAPALHWLDPYRSLAAQEYCVGLERKVNALNALGAPALVAKPEHLESAIFSAYVNVRRLGRA